MFRIGDPVVHPGIGAGVVVGLRQMPVFGEQQYCYRIDLLARMKTFLYVPVDKVDEMGVRRAVTGDRLAHVWRALAHPPDELPEDRRERLDVCETKLQACRPVVMAELVRDLAWRNKQRRLSARPRQIFKRAHQLLTGEIAVVEGIQLVEAELKINKTLESNFISYAEEQQNQLNERSVHEGRQTCDNGNRDG